MVDEAFEPLHQYTTDEMIETLEELQRDGILKIEGYKVYINY